MISKRLLFLSVPAAILLLSACAHDVPAPDDPDARTWTPAIQSSYSGWQPSQEMPQGNAAYAAAFERADGPAAKPDVPPVKADPVELEIVGKSPYSCLLNGEALSDQDVDRFLHDYVKSTVHSSVRIFWKDSKFTAKANAVGDYCRKLGFREVVLKQFPEPAAAEPAIPAPASAQKEPRPPVQAVLRPVIDRSVPGTIYTIVRGDTLSKIAQKQYHDGNLWYILYNENKAALKNNANKLTPGTKIVIPALKANGAK